MNYAIVENGVVVNVAVSDQPLDDNWIQSDAAQIGWSYDGQDLAPPVVIKDWPAEIAKRRYQEETRGITVGGAPVKTDRESQALITGAALAATIDPQYVCNWKTSAGFITLDATAILAVATAVRNHVQGCFNRESELLDAINNETFEPSMINEGW
jgi:hypothetical protein